MQSPSDMPPLCSPDEHEKKAADINHLLVQFYNTIEEILYSPSSDHNIRTYSVEVSDDTTKRSRSSDNVFLPEGDIFCATEYCMIFLCENLRVFEERTDALKFASSFAAQILWPYADSSLEPESCSMIWKQLTHHSDKDTLERRSFVDSSLARKMVSPSVREFGMSLICHGDDSSLFAIAPLCQQNMEIVPEDDFRHTEDNDYSTSFGDHLDCPHSSNNNNVVRRRLLVVGVLLRHCIRGLFIDACRRTASASIMEVEGGELTVEEYNERVRREACMSLIATGSVTSLLVRLVTSVVRGSVSFPMSNDVIDFVQTSKRLQISDTATSDRDDDIKCLFEEVVFPLLCDAIFIGKGAFSSAGHLLEDLKVKISRVYSSMNFEEWARECTTTCGEKICGRTDHLTCLCVLRKDAEAELLELARMKEKRINAEVNSFILRQFPNGDISDEAKTDIMKDIRSRIEKSSLFKLNPGSLEIFSGENLTSVNLHTSSSAASKSLHIDSENSTPISWQDTIEKKLSHLLGDFIDFLCVFKQLEKDSCTGNMLTLFIEECLSLQHIDLVGLNEAQCKNITHISASDNNVETIKNDKSVELPHICLSFGNCDQSIVFDTYWLYRHIVWSNRYDDILFDGNQNDGRTNGVELEKFPKFEERRKLLEQFSIFSDDEEEEWVQTTEDRNANPFKFIQRMITSDSHMEDMAYGQIGVGEDEDEDVYVCTAKIFDGDCYIPECDEEQNQNLVVSVPLVLPKYVLTVLVSQSLPYFSSDDDLALMYLSLTGTVEDKKERVFSMKRKELVAIGTKYGPSVLKFFLLLCIKHPGRSVLHECCESARQSMEVFSVICRNLWRLPRIYNIWKCHFFKCSEAIENEVDVVDSYQVQQPILRHFLRSHNLRNEFEKSFFGAKRISVADRIESFGLQTSTTCMRNVDDMSQIQLSDRKKLNNFQTINASAFIGSESDQLLLFEVRRLENEKRLLLNLCKESSSTDEQKSVKVVSSNYIFSEDEAQSFLRLEIIKKLNVSSFFIVASSMHTHLRLCTRTNPYTSLSVLYQLLPHLTSCLRTEAIEGSCDGRYPPVFTTLFPSTLWMTMDALTLTYALVHQIVTPNRLSDETHTCATKVFAETSCDTHSSLKYTIDFPSERVANDEKQKAVKLFLVARIMQNKHAVEGIRSLDSQAATLSPIECLYLHFIIAAECKGKESPLVTTEMMNFGDDCSLRRKSDITALFSGSPVFKVRVLERWKEWKEVMFVEKKANSGSRFSAEEEAAAMDLYDQDCEDAFQTVLFAPKSQSTYTNHNYYNRKVQRTTHTIRKSKLFLMFCHFFQALITIATRCRSPEHRRFALKVFTVTLSLFTLPVRRKIIIGLFALAPHGEISSIALSEIKRELEMDIKTYVNPIITWYINSNHLMDGKCQDSAVVLLPPPDLLVGNDLLLYCDHQLIKSIIDAVANWVKSELRFGIHEHVNVIVSALGFLLTLISSDLKIVKEVLFSDRGVSGGNPVGILSTQEHSLLPLMIWRVHDTCLFKAYWEGERIHHTNKHIQSTVRVVVRKSIMLHSFKTYDIKSAIKEEITSEFITHEDTVKNKSAEHLMASLVHSVIDPLELSVLNEVKESPPGDGTVVPSCSVAQLSPLDRYSLEQVITLLKGKYVIV